MDTGALSIRVSSSRGAIPLSSFLRIADKALAILNDLEAAISEGEGRSVQWRIAEVSLGSPLTMTLTGECEPDPGIVSDVTRAYIQGLNCIEQGPEAPPYFSEAALEHAKTIVSVLDEEITEVAFHAGGLTAAPTRRLAANVAALTRTFEDFATFEGRLEMISVHERMTISVYDTLTGERIPCHFKAEHLPKIKSLLAERVAVQGRATYSRSGRPICLEVEQIVGLRDNDQLPQFRDLEGIDVTGGIEPAEYLRRLHGDG